MPYLPEVVVSSTDPLLLVTRRVPGTSLFAVADSIDRDQPAVSWRGSWPPCTTPRPARASRPPGRSRPVGYPLATTAMLRDRFAAWVDPDGTVPSCTGATGPTPCWRGLARPCWCTATCTATTRSGTRGELRLVVDFETAGAAEPEYDLRAFPGPGLGPGVELLTAIVRHYQQAAGRPLSVERIMAWHVRQALGDVLWRTDAGIHLADHRTPPDWVDDLAARFAALGLDPQVPPAAIQQTTRRPDQDL